MKKNLFFLLMLFIFTSCESQIVTALGSAFKNLITGNGFADSSSDLIYNQLKQETQGSDDKKDPSGQELTCHEPQSNLKANPKVDIKTMSNLKDMLCSCRPWGSCDKLSCTCDSLCPKNFEILNRSGNAVNNALENSLCISNGDIEFYKEYSDYSGFCWGHAIVTQRFNRLAKFEPNLPLKFNSEEFDSDRINEYKNIIEKINNNEPVDIPGFKNLYEFSSDPEVKAIFRESLKDNWAANAMSAQGLAMVASGSPQNGDSNNKLFDDLTFRLKHNQSPLIIFNDKNQSTHVHAVLVSGQGTNALGQRYLCINDNNFWPEMNTDCKNKMILAEDGTLKYEKWPRLEIGQVKLSFNENSNTIEQVNNLQAKCLVDKNCEADQENSSLYK